MIDGVRETSRKQRFRAEILTKTTLRAGADWRIMFGFPSGYYPMSGFILWRPGNLLPPRRSLKIIFRFTICMHYLSLIAAERRHFIVCFK